MGRGVVAMRRIAMRRRLLLFLAAIFVPYLILIALSVLVIRQDRELREKRLFDERRRSLNQVRKELLTRLETIRRSEVLTNLKPGERYRYPEVVFVGWIEEDRLILPWERDSAARKSRELIAKSHFEAMIQECEHSEFGSGRPSLASRCYEQALAAAKYPEQAAYGRWLWAQSQDRGGRPKRAVELFQALVDTDPNTTDEDGVPLRLYAAERLLEAGVGPRRILDSVIPVLSARPWLGLASCYQISKIVRGLSAPSTGTDMQPRVEEAQQRVADLIRVAELADSLQNDIHRIGVLPNEKRVGSAWVPYGEDNWLVGTSTSGEGHNALFVVRAKQLLEPFAAQRSLRIVDSRDSRGESLGEAFPGLKVVLESEEDTSLQESRNLQRLLFYFSLLLVAAATSFGGYLLWRDLRGELRLTELRTQFVSSVSHELKTPLTAIRMLAETLQMGRVKDREAQAEYLDTIVNECQRLSRLVDDVLSFAKTEQGKKAYHFRPVQLADTVQDAARALEYPLRRQGFHLHMNVRPGLPMVKADRDALEQAILNLLSNAMKYSGDARDIDLSVCRANGDAVIRVTDHGVGIAPEEQSRIFEKFYRAPTRENQLIPGTGLGLTLVSQIVRAHGGQVEVQSVPGEGSTFSIHLPLENKV